LLTKSGNKKRDGSREVVLGESTSFDGFLRFRETLRIRGKFKGTIEATGALIVDKGAVVEADHISVAALTVSGTVIGAIHALDKVDMLQGADVRGDVTAARLRIADGVLFDGQCSMIGEDKDVEIFSRPAEEIKAELQKIDG
jgi:cytoskeletal protein CcmA (bactofilin family)